MAEEPRLARLQIRAAFENAIREDREAQATSNAGVAGRHEQLARMWRAMHAKAVAVGVLADAREARRQWEALTEPTRRIAIAADLELRRRHPDQQIDPLRSAEPQDAINSQKERPGTREIWVQPTLDGSVHLPGAGRQEAAAGDQLPARAQRDALGQPALGLTPETVADPIPEKILRIADNMRIAQTRIDDLRDTRVPNEDYNGVDLGPAWDVLARRDRDAILQPPKPEITPASEVIRRAEVRPTGYEAEPA